MTLDEFWDHIRATKQAVPEDHAERLCKRLAKLEPDDIIDFSHWWNVMMRESYHRDLWGAAYYANGGCSDDGFIDFRAWLVLQGRDVFQAVVSDPNALADHVGGCTADGECSCECDPGPTAWVLATGGGASGDEYAAYNAAYDARYPERLPRRELDEDWDFTDPEQRKLRLPRFAGDD